ncbi:MAG: DMT family transporter [Gammaproteobacteria bacterium]|nr:DMT family transporter [Gammaproteobacteria bacterium]
MSIPAAYIGVILIWSTTPLAIKWSGEGAGYLFGVAARMVIGAMLCVALIALLRKPLPVTGAALRVYLAGAVGGFGSMFFVYWGATYIPSGWISVIFGLTPILTSLIASLFLAEESLSLEKLLGMCLAFSGLYVIFSGEHASLSPVAGLGIMLVFTSVLLHAISTVWVKSLSRDNALPAISMTGGTLLLIAPLYSLAYAMGDHPLPASVDERTMYSIIYLGIVGSVVGFMLYFYVLKNISASAISLIPLITPVSALLIGAGLNEEIITTSTWIGTALILFGLSIYQWGKSLSRYYRIRVG